MSIQTRPRAIADTTPKGVSPGDANDTQQAIASSATPTRRSPAGPNLRRTNVDPTPRTRASAGADSRPTKGAPMLKDQPSGGPTTSRAATSVPVPIEDAPRGDQATGRHGALDTQASNAAGTTSRPTESLAAPIFPASGGTNLTGRQTSYDAQERPAAGSDPQAIAAPEPRGQTPAAAPGPGFSRPPTPISLALLDPALAFAADVLDDLERVRIANENRLRQLTRTGEDADGQERGFGLDESHPDVARLSAIVETLKKVEHDAELELARKLRKHPLGPWCRAQKGIGEKQAARLLASIGDPYIRPGYEIEADDGTVTVVPAASRTVSALWAYAGLHVVPASLITRDAQDGIAGGDHQLRTGHDEDDAQGPFAGPDPTPGQMHDEVHARFAGRNGGDPDHVRFDDQTSRVGVAPRRRRGEQSRWSTLAKTRVYLVAESCIKQLSPQCRAVPRYGDAQDPADGAALRHPDGCGCSPYRVVYDLGRAKYADALHATACPQCGPAGGPAQPGTPLSAGHQHARAMRLAMKAILRDLWRESRRIHLGEP